MSEAGKQAIYRPEEASPSSSPTLVYRPCRQRTRLSLDRRITPASLKRWVWFLGRVTPWFCSPQLWLSFIDEEVRPRDELWVKLV